MKYPIIVMVIFALQSHAFNLDTATKRNLVRENLRAEKELLLSIAACSKEKKTEGILSCARPLTSEQLSEKSLRKILSWFMLDIKITSLGPCPNTKTEFIPQRVKLNAKKILCGSYNLEGFKKEALFFISTDSANKLRLVNLRP